ncbi:uncharacterized protein LOC144621367 [Crassostrea virginica]
MSGIMNVSLFSFVLILSSQYKTVYTGFNHEVKPTCASPDEECSVDLHVSYIMSMVTYNWTTSQGYPVYYRNGSFFRKLSTTSGSSPNRTAELFEDPLNDDEMNDLITADGNYKFMYAINKQFPAPTLVFYEGQTVNIRVYNDMANEAVTFHWHGMLQTGTPWMDGASMVSQCPIEPGQMFTYRFVASPQGTHWYHSHHGAMRRSGLAGAFIVLPKEGTQRDDIPQVEQDVVFLAQDWQAAVSDIQLVAEMEWFIVGFSAKDGSTGTMSRTYDGSMSTLEPPNNKALVNGKFKSFSKSDNVNEEAVPLETFNVTNNTYIRFRMIQSGITGEYKVSIDQHKLLLVGTDGEDLVPVWVDYLIIDPGETYDVIVFANNTPGNYWIRLETTEVLDFFYNPIKPNVSFAQLHYKEAEVALPDSEARKCTQSEPCVMANCHWSQKAINRWMPHTLCQPINESKSTQQSISDLPVPVPREHEEFQEVFLNFHLAGITPMTSRPSVNTIHYKSPPVPLQVNPDIANDESVVCNNKNLEQCGEYCQCTHVVKLANEKVAQLVLTAEDGLNMGTAHPIHIHGNRLYVVKYGLGVVNESSGLLQSPNQDIEYSPDYRFANWRNASWRNGNVPDVNLIDPPLKDTIVIPYKGYVVLRVKTENPGFWFMHCHLDTHMSVGMALVLQIGETDDMPHLPSNFPRCLNYPANLEPDSLSKSGSNEHNIEGKSRKDVDAFIQLLEENVTSSYYQDYHSPYDMKINFTWIILMIVIMVFLMFGIILLALMLFSRYCTCAFRSRKGYQEIGRDEQVEFAN